MALSICCQPSVFDLFSMCLFSEACTKILYGSLLGNIGSALEIVPVVNKRVISAVPSYYDYDALPGGAPNTFWEPLYMQSTPQSSAKKGTPPREQTVSIRSSVPFL